MMTRNTALGRSGSTGRVYTVVFMNNFKESGDVCIYQADGISSNIMSLAWLVKTVHPTTLLGFQWTYDYDFVWAETGPLNINDIFNATQTWEANLSDKNEVKLAKHDSVYTFEDLTRGPKEGRLYIRTEWTLPSNQFSVGIGMSGLASLVVQAEADMNLEITPSPKYRITFGSYIQGQVLDTDSILDWAGIEFPVGVTMMGVVLSRDHTWSVSPLI